MANNNAPFGFRDLASANGAPSNFPLIRATIAYNDATQIFTNDPVAMTATGGQITQWQNGTSVATNLWGIFKGCKFLSAFTGKVQYSPFWPGSGAVASTAQQSIVAYLQPIALSTTPYFVVQSGSAGCGVNNIGANVDVVLGTGNTLTGQSGAYLDSTFTTTNTLPFRVMGLYGVGEFSDYNNVGPGSESGAYNWVVVAANNMLTTGV
jgi:hypothetical protein